MKSKRRGVSSRTPDMEVTTETPGNSLVKSSSIRRLQMEAVGLAILRHLRAWLLRWRRGMSPRSQLPPDYVPSLL